MRGSRTGLMSLNQGSVEASQERRLQKSQPVHHVSLERREPSFGRSFERQWSGRAARMRTQVLAINKEF